jgi:hypothetical protein
MSSNNFEFDGPMTHAHKERLEEWHSRQIDELWDRAWEIDPAFRASMEAMNRADELDEEITNFEYGLAGDVAAWAANGFSQAEWFEGLASNKVMQCNFKDNRINSFDTNTQLPKAIAVLKSFDLWPWP